MCTVTNARQGLEEETLLEPHVAYSQPSSVSTTAMMDTPLTTQTCIHQTATPPHPAQASEQLSPFSDNGPSAA